MCLRGDFRQQGADSLFGGGECGLGSCDSSSQYQEVALFFGVDECIQVKGDPCGIVGPDGPCLPEERLLLGVPPGFDWQKRGGDRNVRNRVFQELRDIQAFGAV